MNESVDHKTVRQDQVSKRCVTTLAVLLCLMPILAPAALLAASMPSIAASAETPQDYPRVTSFIPPDLAWVPRKLAKEPASVSTNVRYCVFVLGSSGISVAV